MRLPYVPVGQLTLQRRFELLGYGVVISTTERAFTEPHTHLREAFAKDHTDVLAAPIALVNHLFRRAREQRHAQSRYHQISIRLRSKRPAHDLPAENISDDGQSEEALGRRYIRHIGHPQLIDISCNKLTFDQIWHWPVFGITLGRYAIAGAAAHASNAV